MMYLITCEYAGHDEALDRQLVAAIGSIAGSGYSLDTGIRDLCWTRESELEAIEVAAVASDILGDLVVSVRFREGEF